MLADSVDLLVGCWVSWRERCDCWGSLIALSVGRQLTESWAWDEARTAR
jgi:hypothetical protein